MSDEKKPAAVAAAKTVEGSTPAAASVDKFDLTLDEFCTRASSTDGASPELLGGFYHEQKTAGTVKATHEAFAAALAAFAKKPA